MNGWLLFGIHVHVNYIWSHKTMFCEHVQIHIFRYKYPWRRVRTLIWGSRRDMWVWLIVPEDSWTGFVVNVSHSHVWTFFGLQYLSTPWPFFRLSDVGTMWGLVCTRLTIVGQTLFRTLRGPTNWFGYLFLGVRDHNKFIFSRNLRGFVVDFEMVTGITHPI